MSTVDSLEIWWNYIFHFIVLLQIIYNKIYRDEPFNQFLELGYVISYTN